MHILDSHSQRSVAKHKLTTHGVKLEITFVYCKKDNSIYEENRQKMHL